MFNHIISRTKSFVVLSIVFCIPPALAQTANQVKQTPPVKLGTSGGNIHDASNAFCCSGTLGSLVTKGGVDYILSNNHVLADSDTATVGDAISQPGLVDVGCNASLTQTVANFSQAIPLGSANVDAVGVAFELGGDINAANHLGQTAVHAAVSHIGPTTTGIDEVVQFLADHGAKLDVKDARGVTPLAICDRRTIDVTGDLIKRLLARKTE